MLVTLGAMLAIACLTISAIEGHAAWGVRGILGGLLATLATQLTPVALVLLASSPLPAGLGRVSAGLGVLIALLVSACVGSVLGVFSTLLIRDRAKAARHRAWVLQDDMEAPYPG